jgi:hypothetical protein
MQTATAERVQQLDLAAFDPKPVTGAMRVMEAAPIAPVQPPMPAGPVTVEDVIARAAMAGATPEQMQSLLAVAERMLALQVEQRKHAVAEQKRQNELAFRRAFLGFRKLNIIIPKTKEVKQTSKDESKAAPSFWQAEFDVVCELLTPGLADNGLTIRHDEVFGFKAWPTPEDPNNQIPWVYVKCYLDHVDGHTETLSLEGPPDTSGRKTPMQEMQSSGSYMKRQSMLSITGTAAGGEDSEYRMMKRLALDAVREPTLLDRFEAEAIKGTAALRAFYDANVPSEAFWVEHGNKLRKAAKAADAGVKHPEAAQ